MAAAQRSHLDCLKWLSWLEQAQRANARVAAAVVGAGPSRSYRRPATLRTEGQPAACEESRAVASKAAPCIRLCMRVAFQIVLGEGWR